jgi:Tol biopolymer transport system component/C-terminal processing protease CtpA/Prc
MRGIFLLVLTCILTVSSSSEPNQRPYFYEPSVSPTTNEIAFVSGGDIWTVPSTGGEARLLISNPANDTRPLFSPDGKQLAFMSNRTGNEDIFVLTLATGDVRRITYDDGNDHLDAWSRDGKYLYFSTASNDINAMNDVYRVSANGGTPMPVTADRFATEYWAAPAPNANAVAFTAKGTVAGQWWRRGHSHLDESEIWLVTSPNQSPKYEKLSGGGAKEAWPMWSPDGKRVYFMSDRGGAENLWVKDASPSAAARQLTAFKDGRLLWPNISYDGKTIAFERDFGVWKFDTSTGKAAPVEIVLHGAPATPEVSRLNANGQFRDLVLSPDGRKVAFVSHGEIFAGSAKEPGSATRVTATAASEFGLAWSPDSKKIVYVSDRSGAYHVYEYDFVAAAETQLTSAAQGETSPRWSPDGKFIAYIRAGQDLITYDLASKQEQVLTKSHFSKPPQEAAFEWSPDSQWIAFAAPGEKDFRNINVIPVTGGKPEPISFLSNTNCRSIAWAPDGTYLLFSTGQRTETSMVARVDLVPKTPVFREDRFRDLFKDEPERPGRGGGAAAAKPAPKVKIELAGIRRRLSMLPVNVDANNLKISPDGKTLLMTANVAGQLNLYTFSLDDTGGGGRGERVARQVTSTAGQKSNAQWTPDGKEIYYLEAGRLSVATLETRLSRPLASTAEMDVSFQEEKQAVFQQAWQYLNDNFFDPEFNGIDWKATRARFAPVIAGSHTPDEERRIIGLMIGELNSSHSGISMTEMPPPAPVTGRLGVRFDPVAYDSEGKLRISEVIAQTPADIAGLKPGQILEAVDHEPIVNLDLSLEHKVDRRVVLTISDGSGKRDIPVKPISRTAEKQLLYRQWVESRREYVDKISNGRLGYVHMADMSEQALTQLYLDLDAANQSKKGIVVDIRNNNGGFVNAYALDVLSRKPYLQMAPRGLDAAPARTVLGQRALELPTVLVVNQHSLSDAEDFTEGYRAMKLGKVVGEPTAGWIIYTSNYQLIDGSSLRLPSTRITTATGEPMEMHPRPVDIQVDRPIGESYTGKDIQLDAAVKALM